jgi:3-phenylpropionate/trans-cinnamate dioxygenase ferredoxin reductase component
VASYKYIIVGGGMTADAAVRGIRELDAQGSIAIIGDDPHPPYNRPYLSKKLWQGKPFDSVWRKTGDLSVDLILDRKVTSLEPQTKTVRDERGEEYTYEKLLLATGAAPRRLPFGGEDVTYFRTLDDYQRLRALTGHSHVGVIGGGFIGSEIAAALAMNGQKVTMIFPEDGVGSRVFPYGVALFLNDYYREKGVEVMPEANVTDIQKANGVFLLAHDKGGAVQVDAVVAGIGVVPNIDLARSAGLKTGNGIVVDEFLRADHPDIYAAGDVAEFFQPALGIRMRVEHEDNALIMGGQAGQNMAGANQPYHHLPYFYSDLFDLGYEAVGILDPRLETFVDWQEPFQKGVIYYLDGGRVRGVLLWNVWDTVPAARALIAEPGPFKASDLKKRLP